MRRKIVVALAALLTSCATVDAVKKTADASPVFRACYGEAKVPWLVDTLIPPDSSPYEIQNALEGLISNSLEAVQRAKFYVLRRRESTYKTSQIMAAEVFTDCHRRDGGKVPSLSHATACFNDQQLLFVATDMRFNQAMSEAEAREAYLSNNATLSSAARENALRLIHDTYIVLTPGEESAFFEAQFQLCMNGR